MGVYIDENLDTINLSEALGEISSERRDAALRFRDPEVQRQSVAVYLLLKTALKKEYGLDENPRFAYGVHGKPLLVDHPEIHFSFSHCARAAACAVADHPIGIDVEMIAPVNWDVAERALSADECAAVRTAENPSVAFAVYWTRKEALAKLTGEGIDESKLPTLLSETDGLRFRTEIHQERGYVLTVCRRARPESHVSSRDDVHTGFSDI